MAAVSIAEKNVIFLMARHIGYHRLEKYGVSSSKYSKERKTNIDLTCYLFVRHTLSEMENFKFQLYVAH